MTMIETREVRGR